MDVSITSVKMSPPFTVAMRPERWFVGEILLLCFVFPICTCIDTLTPSKSITGTDVLVSSGQIFALGFFRPGNSSNRYLGIWYRRIPEQTVVWVANRDNPIKENSSGVLTINSHGDLIILDGNTNTTLWSTNASIIASNKNSIAKLLDSGNLILTQSEGERVLWQSFDYPTDTSLPGMKLGLSPRLGLNWSLISWKSKDDPGPGNYSFVLDPRGSPEFFLSKGSERLWRSGPWNGQRLSATPALTLPNLFNYRFVNTPDEMSMTYSVTNTSVLSRFYLDGSGSVQRLAWIEETQQWNSFWSSSRDKCDKYGSCGPYSICNDNNAFMCSCPPGYEPKSLQEWNLGYGSNGCVRKRGAQCGNGDGFLKLLNLKVPVTSVARVDMNLGLIECEQECLRNCSCTAYSAANISEGDRGCLAWYGDLLDMREFLNRGQELYIRVDAIELAANRRKESKGFHGKKRTITIVSVCLLVWLLALVSCGYYLVKKRRKRKEEERSHRQLFSFNLPSNSGRTMDPPCADELEETRTNIELPLYDLSIIVTATDNFSTANKLGEGGFGPVYKGQLFNGQEIAVKRLSKSSGQGMEEFKNEIILIAKLQHRNLVRILGCCFRKEEKMIIYEYLPNKSLDSFIFDKSKRELLDWSKRFRIVVGIARGMMYLHQDSRLRIIHRDLKASNVLLDADMNPKISDFGIAKIFDGERSEANTNRVAGTYGYMSPEYAMNGLFSVKSDVFSFGVLLLEIISGRRNSNYYHDEDAPTNLIGHVWNLWKEGRGLEIVDAYLCDSCSANLEVLRCIQIGLLCVQDSPSDRPTMSTIIFMLSNETKLPLPKQPAFVATKIEKDPTSSSSGTASGSVASVNNVTITMFQAR